MSATTMLLLMPVLFTSLCWLLSWRRTPVPVLWLAVGVATGAFGVGIVEAVLGVHHTLAGLAFGEVAGIALPAIVTGCIEVTACALPGRSVSDIARWRAEHRMWRLPSRDRWSIATRAHENGVTIAIKRGRVERIIGTADPLADMEGFMDLRVRAEQAAETMNALKVGE